MRCPAAGTQAACLVEGSNQHHYYYLLLLLSLSWRSLLIVSDVFWQFSVAGVSVGDAIRLLQLGTAVGRDTIAVDVEYHGGLGGIGIGSAMVVGVKRLEVT